ncbi:hypothetical protein D031_4882, partial [Vibrio parahaemolyticus VP-48]
MCREPYFRWYWLLLSQ